jgi:hypothetical protein
MITLLNRTFNVSTPNSGATLINWTITADNPQVEFSQANGTIFSTSGTIVVDITFPTEASIPLTTITITCEDNSADCSPTVQTFNLANPCANFDLTLSQTTNSNYDFAVTALPTGGGAVYEYDWIYDQVTFSTPDSTTQTLLLNLNPGASIPDSTVVTCTVTNGRNCTRTVSLVLTICRASLSLSEVRLACLNVTTPSPCGGDAFITGTELIQATTCSGTSIDWSTLQVTTSDPGICVDQVTDFLGNPTAQINIYITQGGLGSGTLTINVADTNGIPAQTLTVNFDILDCPLEGKSVSALAVIPETQVTVLTAAQAVPAQTIYINPISSIPGLTESNLDWSTFTFIDGTGQTLVSSDELTATNGTATLENKQIKYVTSSQVENVDLVQFQITDINGIKINKVKLYLDWEYFPLPTTVADSYTVEAGVRTELDVLSNDSGDFNSETLSVGDTSPTEGDLIKDSGKFYYRAGYTNSLSDSFTYKVFNTNKQASADTTVTLTIVSAGVDGSVTICEEQTVDLENIIERNGAVAVTSGGTWTAGAANPSSPSLATPSAVDFTGATEGTYLFTYEVTSGSITTSATATVYFNPVGSRVISTLSTTFLFGSGTDPNTIRGTFSFSGITEESEITVKLYRDVTGYTPPLIADANLFAVIPITTFDAGSGILTIDYASAEVGYSYQLQLVYTDSCGNEQTQNSAVATPT